MELISLKNHFVSEIINTDITNLSRSDKNDLIDHLIERKVLIYAADKNKKLTHDEYIKFCSIFGRIWTTDDDMLAEKEYQFEHYKELVRISNIFGKLGASEIHWHADATHHPLHAYPVRALYAEKLPSDEISITTWSDQELAFKEYPEEFKNFLRTLSILHKPAYETGWNDKDVIHPVVRSHPITGKESLSIDRYFSKKILEIKNEIQSDLLKDYLIKSSTNFDNTYTHVWGLGDIAIFDNNNTLHKRSEIKSAEERLLLRITLDLKK